MNRNLWKGGALAAALIVSVQVIRPQEAGTKSSSYAPVDIHETFAAILNRMTAAKPEIMRRQMTLLEQRYDLSDRPAKGATMSRSKPLQEGVRMKLPSGITWDQLAKLTPEEIKERGLFPAGFLPLPHPNHPEGGMLFPKAEIEEIKKQEERDLTRFDLDYDVPEHFLAGIPAAHLSDDASGPRRCVAGQASYT